MARMNVYKVWVSYPGLRTGSTRVAMVRVKANSEVSARKEAELNIKKMKINQTRIQKSIDLFLLSYYVQ